MRDLSLLAEEPQACSSSVIYYKNRAKSNGRVYALGFRIVDKRDRDAVAVELVGDYGEDAVVDSVKQYLRRTHSATEGLQPRDEAGHKVFTLLVPKPGFAVSTSDDPITRVERGVLNCARWALERAFCEICAQA